MKEKPQTCSTAEEKMVAEGKFKRSRYLTGGKIGLRPLDPFRLFKPAKSRGNPGGKFRGGAKSQRSFPLDSFLSLCWRLLRWNICGSSLSSVKNTGK